MSSAPRPRWPAARCLVVALFLASLPITDAHSTTQAESPFAGHWEGEIETPGQQLQVMIDLAQDADGAWTGTIDIPLQGAKDLPLGGFDVGESRIQFQIQGVPGEPTFVGELEGDEISGDLTQGPAKLPFRLGRDEVEPPPRPQEPQPPFPYEEQEVEYDNGEVHLAGTLTLPPGEGPFPAALLITGSGAQDRNEALLGHKPFLVLADHLTRGGIAVLRVDDRGVGGSTGNTAQSTSEDFAGDVVRGVLFLADHPRIAADRIGLIGHSEGGLVGPLAAVRSERIAFVVMLAGPGVPGSEILPHQLRLIGLASGLSDEALAPQIEAQKKVVALLAGDADNDTIDKAIRDLVTVQTELAPEELRPKPEDLEKALEMAIRQTNTPWFRFFVAYDPRPTLARLEVPVLALNGELDLQVDPDQNLPEIEKALRAGGNEDITLRRLPGLNHLFQHATTGAVSEYAQIEETMSPEVLDLVRGWILERFGP